MFCTKSNNSLGDCRNIFGVSVVKCTDDTLLQKVSPKFLTSENIKRLPQCDFFRGRGRYLGSQGGQGQGQGQGRGQGPP